MIFISYRRADSESVVGRVYTELRKHFPSNQVFLDHESLPLGKPFLEQIKERLARSKFALILIGPQWCSIQDEKTGQPRIDDPEDMVRLEVETAMRTPGVAVIPVWVLRASVSAAEIAALPPSIRPLFRNHGIALRPVPDEDGDIQRLIRKIAPRNRFRRGVVALAVAALLMLGGVGVWLLRGPPNTTDRQVKSIEPTKAVPLDPPPRPITYKGSVDLLVHRKDQDGSDLALPLSDVRVWPLKPGDAVKVTADVEPLAYVYLFWIDETGTTYPIYPWTPLKWQTRPKIEQRVTHLDVKDPNGNWFKISGQTQGMETIQMLARPEPLKATEAQIMDWFRDLHALPFSGERSRVWFQDFDLLHQDLLRSPEYGEARLEDGPLGLQSVLRQRIGTLAGFSRAVSFSRLGKR